MWQTTDNAPRDSTQILLDKNGTVVIAHWNKIRNHWSYAGGFWIDSQELLWQSFTKAPRKRNK